MTDLKFQYIREELVTDILWVCFLQKEDINVRGSFMFFERKNLRLLNMMGKVSVQKIAMTGPAEQIVITEIFVKKLWVKQLVTIFRLYICMNEVALF